MIINNQYGFLKNKLCETKFMSFPENVTSLLDQGNPADIAPFQHSSFPTKCIQRRVVVFFFKKMSLFGILCHLVMLSDLMKREDDHTLLQEKSGSLFDKRFERKL